MSPERLGISLGHGAFVLVSRALRSVLRLAIVVAPGVPILIALSVFDPASSTVSRCWCALAIAIVTALFWGSVYYCADRARSAAARPRQSKTSS